MADTNTVNQQILDALSESATRVASQPGGADAVALVLGLAMQNAVAQQQQLYMLQNAATAALVSAMLAAGPEAASRWGEALQIIREACSVADVSKTLAQLTELVERLGLRAAGAAASAGSAESAATTTGTAGAPSGASE